MHLTIKFILPIIVLKGIMYAPFNQIKFLDMFRQTKSILLVCNLILECSNVIQGDV